MRYLAWSWTWLCVVLGWSACMRQGASAESPAEDPNAKPGVVRFKENPIIRGEMLPARDGGNINGPSLIRVPDWLPQPLGKYYLYFAHHRGTYIRLAYSDRLEGPWTIHKPGTLRLEEVEVAGGYEMKGGHIASPDVHVDHDRKEIRMYFHGKLGASGTWGHRSGVALSRDGIRFKPHPKSIGDPYFRVFQWKGAYYAVTRSGSLVRSKDGLEPFAEANTAFDDATRDQQTKAAIRHTALKLDGKVLTVFFSRAGDTPERILVSRAELEGPHTSWRLSAPQEVVQPEMDYEGGKLPLEASRGGLINVPVRQLRDPAIFREDGRTYLLYSVAGEHGIAIAELKGRW
jgi:hypothetical protein